MNIIWLQIASLIYVSLLAVAFLVKEKIKSNENNYYTVLLISNILGLIIEFFCVFSVRNREVYPIFNMVITKTLLIYYMFWITFFTKYIFSISYKKDKDKDIEDYKKYKKKSAIFTWLYFFINSIVICFLPLEYYSDSQSVYSYGAAVNYLAFVYCILIVIWIIKLILNFKRIKDKKYLPIFTFIFGGTILEFVQVTNPELLLTTPFQTLVVVLMYFTIENPDVSLLREIANKKDEANRINNDKAMFLFNMSQDIKKPVMDIQTKCENALMGETVDEIKDGIRSIKESANQASRLINASLNISEASSANLKLVNKKYNVNLLFKQLVEMTKTKLKDKEVEFRYNIDDSIPEYLMGDSIRFKQMVAIILNNAIKHTEKGYIELDVSYVIKVDVCSFIINVIDTGKGMSQEKLNEALNSSKEVTGSDEDIATSKTLAGLSNGTIMGVSEEGKGSKFTIIVNQKIAPEEENSSIERSVLKVDSDKKILVVENDEKEQNKIIKLLKDENISIEITNMGVGCLEKIRNGSHYDLIIINEELPKLSGIMTYQKLKIINNFNIPVIMMIDKSHEEYIEKYLDLGIKKCLIKQDKKTTKDNILEVLRRN